MSKRDELPLPVCYGPFKDIEILVAPQHTKITGVLAVPAVYDLLDLYGPIAHHKPYGALIALVACIAFNLDFHVALP